MNMLKVQYVELYEHVSEVTEKTYSFMAKTGEHSTVAFAGGLSHADAVKEIQERWPEARIHQLYEGSTCPTHLVSTSAV